MQELWAQIGPELVGLLGILITGLIVLAKSKLADYIKAKQSNAAMQGAMLWLNDMVSAVVVEAAQVTVSGIKKDLADGKITKEEAAARLAEVKKAAVAKVIELTWGRVGSALGMVAKTELQPIVEAKVEAAVPVAKALVQNPS